MRRFKFAGHKVYHGGNSSNILKFFSAALSLTSRSVNFGTQIGNFGFCVPARRRFPAGYWRKTPPEF
jgi:hypothetical protein